MKKSSEARAASVPELKEQPKGPEDKSDLKGVTFEPGQEVAVRRTSGHLDSGWKIGIGFEGATVQVIKDHPTKPGKYINKWLPREEIAAANLPDASEFVAPEPSSREVSEVAADGSKLELVTADEGEGYNVVTGKEAGTAIRPEGHAEMRERTAADLAELKSSYDNMLQATLKAQKIDGAKAEAITKAAEAQKTLYLLDAAADEDPQSVISSKIEGLLKMSEEELVMASASPSTLQLETAARKAEMSLIDATTMEAMSKADRGLELSAYELGLRRTALKEAAGEEADQATEMARAEGFIEVSYSPLYEQGADATRDRIAELEGEMRELESLPDSQRTSGAEIHLNRLHAERKKHMAVLPMLNKMQGMADALTSIDERTDKAVQEHNNTVKAAVLKIARQRGAYGANIAKKSAIMKARDGFMKFWEGMPWAEDAQADRDAAETKLQEFEATRDRLVQEAEDLENMGVLLDFDPAAEKQAAETELRDYLIGLARDGEVAGAKEFVALMLGKESTSDAERAVLEQTLQDIEEPKHDDYEVGAKVNVEFLSGGQLKLEGTIVGFTLDGKVKVDLGEGKVATFDDEMVVELAEREIPQSSLDVVGVPQGARVAVEHDDGTKDYGEVLGYDGKTGEAKIKLENGDVVSYDREMVVELDSQIAVDAETKQDWEELDFDLDSLFDGEVDPEQVYIDEVTTELGVNTEELDGVKASYELVKTMLKINEKLGGAGISMEAMGLPENWSDFLQLGTKKDRGFFSKVFRGKSDMQKGMDSLGDAFTSQLATATEGLPSSVSSKIQALKDRASNAPSHVFNVKI